MSLLDVVFVNVKLCIILTTAFIVYLAINILQKKRSKNYATKRLPKI